MTFDALRRRWGSFARSPLLPAAVIVVIAAVAAALFAGSYSYAMANPAPRDIPVAVTGTPTSYAAQQAFLAGMQHATGASLHLHQYDTYAQAREAVDQQREFAIMQLHSGAAELDVSSASGAAVAEVLAQVAPQVGQSIGHTVSVRDINPLHPGDPRGLAIFYITLATVIVGFVGAIQLSVHARALRLGQLIAVTAAYAALGGLAMEGEMLFDRCLRSSRSSTRSRRRPGGRVRRVRPGCVGSPRPGSLGPSAAPGPGSAVGWVGGRVGVAGRSNDGRRGGRASAAGFGRHQP
jgi:hypothetical protein